ncbi:MAG: glycosyltransferase family 2 protein [Pikeienuella sp.]|uniref:glycosyltransferase family 2 protein n=1 Tax=Pikeienuella sp. TaxID=2831957 RepID=UPI00391A5CE9
MRDAATNEALPIARLWPGGAPSWLDLLTFAAIREAGHPLILYSWGPAPGPPDWAERRDAGAISPEGDGEDRFRWRLLATEPGLIWAGAGALLLGSLAPVAGRLYGRESARFVSPEIVALSPESPALGRMIEACDAPEEAWGDLGARGFTAALEASGEAGVALPEGALHGPAYAERGRLLERGPLEAAAPEGAVALSLHLPELARALAAAPGGLPRWHSPLGRLARRFGVDPRAAPVPGAPPPAADDPRWAPPAPAPAPRRVAPTGRVLIVTTMKNEGPFLLEWIAYHRAVAGVTDFLVYTNDCEDGTDEFHALLARKGIVSEHRENPFREMKNKRPQHAALSDAPKRPVFAEADWIMPMDCDEFVNIHVGAGRFQDLLDAAPEATAISMIWRLFGSGFVSAYEDAFVTERHLFAAHERANKPHQAWGFKTAFRNDGAFAKLDVHRPKAPDPDRATGVRWITGSGAALPDSYLKAGWRATPRTAGYGLVTLNHYAVRSAESFLVKRDRGRVNHVDRDQGLAYWFRMNHNAVEERSILRHLPAAKAEFARLMADPEIAAMHRRAVSWHREKIAELKTRPDYAALFAEIESPRMRALSRILARFGNAVFDKGPEAALAGRGDADG